MLEEVTRGEVAIENLVAFDVWVQEFAKSLSGRAVILLSGELGSGKTQFVKFLVQDDDVVSSPSFALHNNYRCTLGDVDHVDLYRLENDEDLESSGFWDLFDKSQGYVVVEWANRLNKNTLPLDWPIHSVHIEKVEGDEMARKIVVKKFTRL